MTFVPPVAYAIPEIMLYSERVIAMHRVMFIRRGPGAVEDETGGGHSWAQQATS